MPRVAHIHTHTHIHTGAETLHDHPYEPAEEEDHVHDHPQAGDPA